MGDNEDKKINITGTNNRYMIKKLTKKTNNAEIKKRVESKKWCFSSDVYETTTQKNIINDILTNNFESFDEKSNILIQQINKKIYGYKQQDILKKMYNENKFINLKNIIQNMVECELKCRYCKEEMFVLYDLLREQKQWSVDRVNNNEGHNLDNYYLSCLKCNLKKRRISDEKFLFTKQLNIIKNDS
jgi:hypothetical protein